MNKIKVCYILSYYSPRYVRTLSLSESLKKIDGVKLFEARNTKKGFLRYFQTLFKLLSVRIRNNPDIYILGFRGHEIFLPVKLLTLGKKLIFDEFMSPYDSYINERKKFKSDGIPAKIGYLYEKFILNHSNL